MGFRPDWLLKCHDQDFDVSVKLGIHLSWKWCGWVALQACESWKRTVKCPLDHDPYLGGWIKSDLHTISPL